MKRGGKPRNSIWKPSVVDTSTSKRLDSNKQPSIAQFKGTKLSGVIHQGPWSNSGPCGGPCGIVWKNVLKQGGPCGVQLKVKKISKYGKSINRKRN